MAAEEKVSQIQKFLEGLEEYSKEFFFPYDRILYEDIKDKIQQPEFERFRKYFDFPLEEQKPVAAEKTVETVKETYTPPGEVEEAVSDEEVPETGMEQDASETFSLLDELEDLQRSEVSAESMDSFPDLDDQISIEPAEETAMPETEFPEISGESVFDDNIFMDTQDTVTFEGFDVTSGDTVPDMDTSDLVFQETPDITDSIPGDFASDLPSWQDTGDTGDFLPEESLSQTAETAPDIDFTFDTPPVDDVSAPEDLLETPPGELPPESLDFDVEDLKEMEQQSLLQTGIGTEYTDEELAKLRQNLLSYSEPVRKAIIDAIVNEKIPRTDQKLLINMLIEEAEETTIADFIEEKLGYRPRVTQEKTKEGIPIIYTDDVAPEAIRRKKKRILAFFIITGAGIFLLLSFLIGTSLYKTLATKNLYEEGLRLLQEAKNLPAGEKYRYIERAEALFQEAVLKYGTYDIHYLNLYGRAYIELGEYDRAFEKLFGKIQPDYDWSSPVQKVPLIRRVSPWYEAKDAQFQKFTEFMSDDNVRRTLIAGGGFTVARLRDGNFHKENLLALGRFHSLNFPHFLNSETGRKYKNDNLAIDYYNTILTLMGKANDPDALEGIARVYYNRKQYNLALSYYQNIVDNYPHNVTGHDGIINTYIEIWKEDGDPRYVIAKHRNLQNMGLEEKLPLYTLTKLAGFYIDLHPLELNIRYNVDPVNSVTEHNIEDTALHLLDLAFHKEEKRGNITIKGKEYGEGFYQRGRFLNKTKQYQNAVRQFQYAYYYEPRHFPAIIGIGDYYLYRVSDYEKAKEYYLKALETYLNNRDFFGLFPEDETFLSYDAGKIYYAISSVIFEKNKNKQFPSLISLREPSQEYEAHLNEFLSTEEYLIKALENVKDMKAKDILHYRLGFLQYLKGNFDEAIKHWVSLSDPGLYSIPEYYLALGNASILKDQYQQALHYFKLAEALLEKKEKLTPIQKNILYQVYNNLGAAYELLFYDNRTFFSKAKLDRLREQSLNYYYKAVEFALKNKMIPAKAKVNIDLSFRREKEGVLIEDAILPVMFPE